MSGEILVVNFSALQQAGADIQKALTQLDTELSQLDSDAKPLVASWDGEAQAAYAARQAKWTAASNDLKAILNSIKVAVDESAADYLNTEKRATGLFH